MFKLRIPLNKEVACCNFKSYDGIKLYMLHPVFYIQKQSVWIPITYINFSVYCLKSNQKYVISFTIKERLFPEMIRGFPEQLTDSGFLIKILF